MEQPNDVAVAAEPVDYRVDPASYKHWRVMYDGELATITMDVRAHHVHDPDDPASWYTIGGHYDDTLVRLDGRWLLTGVRLTVTSSAGDPAIMELARETGKRLLSRGRGGTAGSDPEPPGQPPGR